MELYLAGVGVQPSLKQWEKDMQAVKLPFKYKENGEEKEAMIRLGVGEVKLYKIIFPEEHLDTVMAISGASNDIPNQFPKINKMLKIFKKMLGVDEAPEAKKELIQKYYTMLPEQLYKAVRIIPIGIRKDIKSKDGMEHI